MSPAYVPEILPLESVPAKVRARLGSLNTHLGSWGRRAVLDDAENRVVADLMIEAVELLIVDLHGLRDRLGREVRQYERQHRGEQG